MPSERRGMAVQSTHRAYDEPETPDEISRRTFMANAMVTIGGVVGLVLAIPIVGSLLPAKNPGTAAGLRSRRPNSPNSKRRRRSR